MHNLLKRQLIAEFLGTFFLVFFGTGAVIVSAMYNQTVDHLGVSIAFGLVVLCIIYTIGSISGAHLNPAVSMAFYIHKKMTLPKCLWYSLIQILGAIAASYILFLLFPQTETLGETLPAGTVLQTFVMEFILSLFLMFVILGVSTGSKEQGIIAGIAVGFAVLICALVGGPISGASMNPARSIGPAIAAQNLEVLWLYILAPILGMFSSVFLWNQIKNNKAN